MASVNSSSESGPRGKYRGLLSTVKFQSIERTHNPASIDMASIVPPQPEARSLGRGRGRQQQQKQSPLVGSSRQGNVLYVHGIPVSVSEVVLKKEFSVAGQVKAVRIIRSSQAVSCGKTYGFVEYFKPSEAKKAVQVMNGQPLAGSKLTVSWSAHPRPLKPGRSKAAWHPHPFIASSSEGDPTTISQHSRQPVKDSPPRMCPPLISAHPDKPEHPPTKTLSAQPNTLPTVSVVRSPRASWPLQALTAERMHGSNEQKTFNIKQQVSAPDKDNKAIPFCRDEILESSLKETVEEHVNYVASDLASMIPSLDIIGPSHIAKPRRAGQGPPPHDDAGIQGSPHPRGMGRGSYLKSLIQRYSAKSLPKLDNVAGTGSDLPLLDVPFSIAENDEPKLEVKPAISTIGASSDCTTEPEYSSAISEKFASETMTKDFDSPGDNYEQSDAENPGVPIPSVVVSTGVDSSSEDHSTVDTSVLHVPLIPNLAECTLDSPSKVVDMNSLLISEPPEHDNRLLTPEPCNKHSNLLEEPPATISSLSIPELSTQDSFLSLEPLAVDSNELPTLDTSDLLTLPAQLFEFNHIELLSSCMFDSPQSDCKQPSHKAELAYDGLIDKELCVETEIEENQEQGTLFEISGESQIPKMQKSAKKAIGKMAAMFHSLSPPFTPKQLDRVTTHPQPESVETIATVAHQKCKMDEAAGKDQETATCSMVTPKPISVDVGCASVDPDKVGSVASNVLCHSSLVPSTVEAITTAVVQAQVSTRDIATTHKLADSAVLVGLSPSTANTELTNTALAETDSSFDLKQPQCSVLTPSKDVELTFHLEDLVTTSNELSFICHTTEEVPALNSDTNTAAKTLEVDSLPTHADETPKVDPPPTQATETLEVDYPPTQARETLEVNSPSTQATETFEVGSPPAQVTETLEVNSPSTQADETLEVDSAPTEATETFEVGSPLAQATETLEVDYPPTRADEPLEVNSPPTQADETLKVDSAPTRATETFEEDFPPAQVTETLEVNSAPAINMVGTADYQNSEKNEQSHNDSLSSSNTDDSTVFSKRVRDIEGDSDDNERNKVRGEKEIEQSIATYQRNIRRWQTDLKRYQSKIAALETELEERHSERAHTDIGSIEELSGERRMEMDTIIKLEAQYAVNEKQSEKSGATRKEALHTIQEHCIGEKTGLLEIELAFENEDARVKLEQTKLKLKMLQLKQELYALLDS